MAALTGEQIWCSACEGYFSRDRMVRVRKTDATIGLCRGCHAVRAERWRQNHKDKVKADNQRRRQERDAATVERERQRKAEYWAANRDKFVERSRAQRYGITLDELNTLREIQGNQCAICGALPGKRDHCIDHDHETGEARGLLCHPCNRMLGQGQDDPERLRRGAEYLEAYRARS